jgi:RNA polymerase sigma factor (sigma-70 family)
VTHEPYLDGAVTSTTTDDQLLVSVRAGETEAYGELWRRHVRVALAVAGRYSTIADPDDIVQEAFQAVFTAVRDGGGPTRGFRPYLARTVRNVAVSISRRRRAEPVGGLTELADRLDVSVPGHDDTSTDRMVLVTAFHSLPERWRAILWMTEVEDLPVQDAAARLGIAPNAGAALVRRAREGLRRSWLAAHVGGGDPAPECRWVVERLPLAVRGDATSRHQDRIDAHTATCQDCARAALEIAAVARRLPAVLLPIVFTGGAAAERLLSGVSPVAPDGSTLGRALLDRAEPRGTRPERAALRTTSRVSSASKAVAVAVVAAAAVVVVGVVLGRSVLAGPAVAASSPTAGPPRSVATSTSPDGSGHDPEGGSGTPSPSTTTDAPSPDAPSRQPEADGSSVLTEPADRPGPVASALLLPGLLSAREIPADPASPPTTVAPLTVTAAPASGLREWLPVVAGGGETGATVEAVLADGTVIGSAQVVDGTWSITLDRSVVVDVEHEVSVRYEGHDGLVAVGRYTFVAPLVVGTEVTEGPSGGPEVVVLVTGTCGHSVEASVAGVHDVVSTVLGDCTTRVPLPGLGRGSHTVELRYVDQVRGRVGAVRSLSVTL